MSATGSIFFFLLASLKCPLACFTVIWFYLFVLRYRGNEFTLIEGSYYEDLHYCFFQTNRIVQKLVINVMGRSKHAIWVITLDPPCLMVCYAEQRVARSLLGERQVKNLIDSFFFQTNLQAESCCHSLNYKWSNNSEDFFPLLWPMSVGCKLTHVVQGCSKVIWWR